MKNKFYYILGGFMIAILLSTSFNDDSNQIITKTEANPDFICIKDVDSSACNVTGTGTSICGPWENKKRTCTGERTLQLAYYSIRIGCAEGGEQIHIGSREGASGRRTADSVRTSESCTVIQEDNTPPTGEPQVITE